MKRKPGIDLTVHPEPSLRCLRGSQHRSSFMHAPHGLVQSSVGLGWSCVGRRSGCSIELDISARYAVRAVTPPARDPTERAAPDPGTNIAKCSAISRLCKLALVFTLISLRFMSLASMLLASHNNLTRYVSCGRLLGPKRLAAAKGLVLQGCVSARARRIHGAS
jgi:hypothetical protein